MMRKPLLAPVFAVALAIGLGGCVSLLPKVKPAQLYRFGVEASIPAPSPPMTPSAAAKIGLVLGTIGFPRASSSDGILTVKGDETAYLAGVRWVAPARQLFTEAMQRAFEQKSVRTEVVNVGDLGPAGAVLRVDVTSFEARYDRSGQAPTIVVTAAARLTRSDGRLLDQRAFAASKPAAANSVATIVTAFDQATGEVLTNITGWADTEVATIGSTPPPPAAPNIVTTTQSSSTTTTSVQPH